LPYGRDAGRERGHVATAVALRFRQSLAEISGALGYESEKSFSATFKRVMRCSPRQRGWQMDRGSLSPMRQDRERRIPE
jgi:AraC-like DNA-binding protein